MRNSVILLQGVGGSVTFTRQPPPAEVGEWRCRLKGREVSPCLAPIGTGREAAAMPPSRPTRSESAGDKPTTGRSTVRAGWLCRSRARTSEGGGSDGAGCDPSHLRLAPSGREDTVAPLPGPVGAAGRRRWRSAGSRPSHLHLAPSGRGGTATPRPGQVRAAGPRGCAPRAPVVVTHWWHSPGGAALPLPGPGR